MRQEQKKIRRQIPRWLIWSGGIGALVALAGIGACVFVLGVLQGRFYGIPGIITNEGLAATPKPGDVQVNETFDGAYKWSTGIWPSGSSTESGGQLSIESTASNGTYRYYTVPFVSMWGGSDYSINMSGGTPDWLQLGNLDMTMDASVEKDVGQAMFGAACRYQDDANFYAFIAYSTGHFVIGKTVKGKDEGLSKGDSSAIHTGPASNQVHIMCSGSKLTFAVNGTDLATVTDTDLKTGIVALIGGTGGTSDRSDAIVHFDNLVIKAP